MPSPPRLTAADAETLLVSAGFLYLDRRGQHRIYGRERTRVVVSFDGRSALHPKAVRMIVESIERSRPATTFEIDRNLVGMSQAALPPMRSDLMLRDAAIAAAPPVVPAPAAAAAPPPAPEPRPLATPGRGPTDAADPEQDIDLPRPPKPKGAWS